MEEGIPTIKLVHMDMKDYGLKETDFMPIQMLARIKTCPHSSIALVFIACQ